MADSKTEAPTQLQSTREIHRIRDIIFGPQMRDYEQRFQTLQRDLERIQQEVDNLTGQLSEQESSQGKKLQSLRSELRKADDGLRGELRETAQSLTAEKVDRVTLGELFTELGKHLIVGGSLGDMLQELMETEQD